MPKESYVCRRLIVLLDGTWNDADEAGPATNIVYLRELLFWGLQRRFSRRAPADTADYERLDEDHRKKAASGMIFDGFEYIVYYGRGVGTGGLVDRIKGRVCLRGFRGAEPADEAAFRRLLVKVSQVLHACPEIQELDLNPVMVLPSGAMAADVRIRVGRRSPAPAGRRRSVNTGGRPARPAARRRPRSTP